MAVLIRPEPFAPWSTLGAFEEERLRGSTRIGATACFLGSMRDFNAGTGVSAMTLEHYPGMTERELEKIIDEARERWALEEVLIVHRVGRIEPAEPIVLTAVWSAHRKEAFEACRFLMEALKSRAPFWKQETLEDGERRWVEENTPGY